MMAYMDKGKAQIILDRMMELEKEYERDDTITETKVISDIKKVLEGIVDAIEID